ncbi:uroporphyrinogen-III C-methyltransferase /precorrin-2 dehydrogenase [Panacagrimonas perspica]|uniref:Siroheme synthase n=1 Tax=Panacagrimonas perspica TaxID=381431 RepID=A0A4S3JZV1_9GAMM|nr:siroheme synthase CysG [Panacagrimonas perspica]TDU32864.1 uroporphyrinogen-III C-methyltransferase /precorrin-2 dehydrogenase [Panacagrimonas perspica]THD00974.1 uroporphyrinogen-III C-methyltransferase [Panacagrimonas perspica]
MGKSYFPIFVDLLHQPVLVVGGGEVAARKIRLLLKSGAKPRIVALELNEELAALVAESKASLIASTFEPAQLVGMRLAIAATDDRTLNRTVAEAAESAGVLCNVVDDPEASRYITPSIVERGPITVAISTGGSAPVLARRLRERIEALLPGAYGKVAEFMERHRARVKTLPVEQRRLLWEDFLDGPGPERLLAGDEVAAVFELESLVGGKPARGEVYLVGAGPGDPDLLSFRALRLMQQCDVVLYDALISPAILDLVRRDAERIYVGKRRAKHTLPQEDINAELVRLAQAGKRVLRLKGGDPFVFGRGGEEIEELAAAGIPFQIVPGISAANGCAAYSGIPLTHRDYAQSCIFVTGHRRKDGQLDLHWDALARPGQTVVIYMGRTALAELCAQLVANGLPADWPAALIEQGTTQSQQVVTGSLGTLPGLVAARSDIDGASLVIVGEVVKLRDRLKWFLPT